MRYLCLIYSDETLWERMPREEVEDLSSEFYEFTAGIRESGHFLASSPLHPTSTATTVRVRDGRISTTDGPFAETKEQLGGYYLVEASDLNDAIQVAARIPAARWGSIEVRPVREVKVDHERRALRVETAGS